LLLLLIASDHYKTRVKKCARREREREGKRETDEKFEGHFSRIITNVHFDLR